MRNRRFRQATIIAAVLSLAWITLTLLPALLPGGKILLAQDGSVPAPNLGPAPTAIPAPGPAPTRGRRQVQRAATATPTPASDSTSSSEALPAASFNSSQAVRIGDETLALVIGDRLSSVLYGLTDRRSLYRSENSGSTWQLLTEDAAVDEFRISPADPRVLYAGQGIDCDAADAETQPFRRSGDGGVTWTRLPIGDNLVPLLAHPQEANTLLAADCDMPYVSTDGGEDWQTRRDRSADSLWQRYRVKSITGATQVGDLPPGQGNWHYLYAAGVDADGSSVVAYSGDEGEAWTRITPRVNPEPRGLSALVADPTTPGRLWFADRNGVWYTDDFGASWLLTRAGLETVLDGEENNGVTALAFGPDGRIYAGTDAGLYHADGISGDWAPVVDEVLQDAAIDGLFVTSGETDVLWINTTEGVYRLALP